MYKTSFRAHNMFKELRQILYKDELQENLMKQAFLSGIESE